MSSSNTINLNFSKLNLSADEINSLKSVGRTSVNKRTDFVKLVESALNVMSASKDLRELALAIYTSSYYNNKQKERAKMIVPTVMATVLKFVNLSNNEMDTLRMMVMTVADMVSDKSTRISNISSNFIETDISQMFPDKCMFMSLIVWGNEIMSTSDLATVEVEDVLTGSRMLLPIFCTTSNAHQIRFEDKIRTMCVKYQEHYWINVVKSRPETAKYSAVYNKGYLETGLNDTYGISYFSPVDEFMESEIPGITSMSNRQSITVRDLCRVVFAMFSQAGLSKKFEDANHFTLEVNALFDDLVANFPASDSSLIKDRTGAIKNIDQTALDTESKAGRSDIYRARQGITMIPAGLALQQQQQQALPGPHLPALPAPVAVDFSEDKYAIAKSKVKRAQNKRKTGYLGFVKYKYRDPTKAELKVFLTEEMDMEEMLDITTIS